MDPIKYIFRKLFPIFAIAVLAAIVQAQGVKRVVIIKVDGLPGYYVDRTVKQIDPATGKSVLPWINEVFYKNGSRVPNFYTRGMSLSGPSWGLLDTGQHLQIKGNVEYDRYTLHAYDYLNFFPYYLHYSLQKGADMPATEVLDQLKIPLLIDAFPYEKRYTSGQLYQRGNSWEVLASGFLNLYPGSVKDFIDEWTIGLNYRGMTVDQTERDIVNKVDALPEVNYFDYYDTSFDHVSHHTSDAASRLPSLLKLDRTIGRIWVAIQASSRADETALVLISDHGFNSEEGVTSQGFNLVKLLASAPGGGHHVITKRRLMLDYSIKGLYPLVPLITTTSKESYYLKDRSSDYPTALVDFDGNERSSLHLRNDDLNVLQILFQQLQRRDLSPAVKAAATDEFFRVINERLSSWQETVYQLREELDALHRWTESQEMEIAGLPKSFSPTDIAKGADKQVKRVIKLNAIAKVAEMDYRTYLVTLTRLLGLKREAFDARKLKIEDLIARGAMGDANSVYQLQNYVVGLSPAGLTLNTDNRLDVDKSFSRVNYFELLHSQIMRNNVQPKVGSRPVDFVAVRIANDAFSDELPQDLRSDENAIWLNSGNDKQALIFSRHDADGGQSFRYLPISGLRQDQSGKVTFQTREWANGFPLKLFEDPNLAVDKSQRVAWLSGWHTENDWFEATHKTAYSNAIIGLNEQLNRHPLSNSDDPNMSANDKLIARFRQRQRQLTEADMLVLANDHWNFDVRGFNPGGNHGSFFRASTNSTFMIAGGSRTGIPRGLTVEKPYDSLSFMPTILSLMGKVDNENRPSPELTKLGFKTFPGRVVKQIVGPQGGPTITK